MLKKNVLGSDLGFVQLKAVGAKLKVDGDNWKIICPSLSKRRSEVIMGDLQDSEGYLITTQELGSWNVGTKGSFNFEAERLMHEDIVKLYAILGLYHAETGSAVIDMLVSGLPVDEYKQESIRTDFASRLKGNFNFGFNSDQCFIQVKQSLVLPQSAGAFFDFVLDDKGEERNVELASEDILVLDIGGKSTDGCIMEEGAFSQDSFTIWQGVYKAQAELRKLIAHSSLRYVATHKEIDNALRTGNIKLSGKQEDVRDYVIKAVDTTFPTIRDELTLHIADFRKFSAIIMSGGGANVYGDHIEDFTKIPCISQDDAEWANANGYRKYGLLKLTEG